MIPQLCIPAILTQLNLFTIEELAEMYNCTPETIQALTHPREPDHYSPLDFDPYLEQSQTQDISSQAPKGLASLPPIEQTRVKLLMQHSTPHQLCFTLSAPYIAYYYRNAVSTLNYNRPLHMVRADKYPFPVQASTLRYLEALSLHVHITPQGVWHITHYRLLQVVKTTVLPQDVLKHLMTAPNPYELKQRLTDPEIDLKRRFTTSITLAARDFVPDPRILLHPQDITIDKFE